MLDTRFTRSLIAIGAAALIAGCASTSPSTPSEDSYNQGMSQAEAALTSGQKEQALSLFEQVARNNPAREEPWSRIAQIQYADQKYPQAIVAAEEALQRDATDRKAKSILAVSGLRVARRSVMELRDDSAVVLAAMRGMRRMSIQGFADLSCIEWTKGLCLGCDLRWRKKTF